MNGYDEYLRALKDQAYWLEKWSDFDQSRLNNPRAREIHDKLIWARFVVLSFKQLDRVRRAVLVIRSDYYQQHQQRCPEDGLRD